MPNLVQVCSSPREASRQSRPSVLRVPPLILRSVTKQRMPRSEPLVCSEISGRSSTTSNAVLLTGSVADASVGVLGVDGGEAGWRTGGGSGSGRQVQGTALHVRGHLVCAALGSGLPHQLPRSR